MLIVVFGPLMAPGEADDVSFFAVLFAGLLLYWALGAVVVLRAAGHAVGWLFAIAAPMTAWVFGCYAIGYMLTAQVPPEPAGSWFYLLANAPVRPRDHAPAPGRRPRLPDGDAAESPLAGPGRGPRRSWSRCRSVADHPATRTDGRRRSREPPHAVARHGSARGGRPPRPARRHRQPVHPDRSRTGRGRADGARPTLPRGRAPAAEVVAGRDGARGDPAAAQPAAGHLGRRSADQHPERCDPGAGAPGGGGRGPALPALRHRPDPQPHDRLGAGHDHPRRSCSWA